MKTEAQIKKALGPLWKLVNDKNIFELVIDSYDEVFYVTKAGIQKNAKVFKGKEQYEAFVKTMLKALGAEEGKSSYFMTLSQHLKLHVVLPPVSLNGPSINITKIPDQHLTLDDLVKFDALDEKGKKIIQDLIKEDKSILVAGNMGSGKTTLLNILVNSLPNPYRVVTVERYADLIINRSMCARLQTQNQTPQEMVELVRIAEKMRPDCLVLSYCSGPEVMAYLDFLRSNCTGMALITAQDVVDALKRLETMALISSEGLSLEDVRYAIAQALQVIIFQEKLSDGKRRVTNISRIEYLSGEIKLTTIYK